VPRGRAKSVPNRVPVAVYMPKKSYLALRERAEKERRSVSMQAVFYIEQGLRKAAKHDD
jgi:hypothetical protein